MSCLWLLRAVFSVLRVRTKFAFIQGRSSGRGAQGSRLSGGPARGGKARTAVGVGNWHQTVQQRPGFSRFYQAATGQFFCTLRPKRQPQPGRKPQCHRGHSSLPDSWRNTAGGSLFGSGCRWGMARGVQGSGQSGQNSTSCTVLGCVRPEAGASCGAQMGASGCGKRANLDSRLLKGEGNTFL